MKLLHTYVVEIISSYLRGEFLRYTRGDTLEKIFEIVRKKI